MWFVEVKLRDQYDFSDKVSLVSRTVCSHHVIHVDGSSVPTCLAGVALWVRDQTGVPPHVYLEWSSGSPVRNYLRFLLWGQGQTATVVHEQRLAHRIRQVRTSIVHIVAQGHQGGSGD